MDRFHELPMLPRGRLPEPYLERVRVDGGGWPDALAWAIFALLLTLVVIAITILALDALGRSQRPKSFTRAFAPPIGPGVLPGGALAVLGTRYARGEISRDEYLQARTDLSGGHDEAPTEVVPPEPADEGGKKD